MTGWRGGTGVITEHRNSFSLGVHILPERTAVGLVFPQQLPIEIAVHKVGRDAVDRLALALTQVVVGVGSTLWGNLIRHKVRHHTHVCRGVGVVCRDPRAAVGVDLAVARQIAPCPVDEHVVVTRHRTEDLQQAGVVNTVACRGIGEGGAGVDVSDNQGAVGGDQFWVQRVVVRAIGHHRGVVLGAVTDIARAAIKTARGRRHFPIAVDRQVDLARGQQ